MIAKSHAFGFDYKSLRVIHIYLSYRTKVIVVGSFSSKILDIIFGALQGSMLGPLFDINIIDLYIDQYKSDFLNYVGNTNPYICGNTLLKPYQT